MIINLKGVYYHYCELPAATYDAFMAAPSMGQFYNTTCPDLLLARPGRE
jgi:hypothetical protein